MRRKAQNSFQKAFARSCSRWLYAHWRLTESPKVLHFRFPLSQLAWMSVSVNCAAESTYYPLATKKKKTKKKITDATNMSPRKASGKGELAHRELRAGRLALGSPLVCGSKAAGGGGGFAQTVSPRLCFGKRENLRLSRAQKSEQQSHKRHATFFRHHLPIIHVSVPPS